MNSPFEPLNASTRFCAVYGYPVKHSASPAMHNAALNHLRLNWRYAGFDVVPEHLGAAIAGAAAMNFIGLNLTVPHKMLAMKLVDVVDERARKYGAINTVRFETNVNGEWKPIGQTSANETQKIRSHGFNTDADAIIRSIREDIGIHLPESRVLLLGAGGAGRVAALRLAEEGVRELWLVNRTASKVQELMKEINSVCPGVLVQIGYPEKKIELVINATSAGLRPEDGLPFEVGKFSLRNSGYAYDMIYRPAETPFLIEAKRSGCKISNGLGMLLYQGAAALELWTGVPSPIEVMREALKRNIYG
ncbi:MAG: shikimate dehydrogenase [Verrucomicrobiota bacterium]|nr:shikimate dehydrogenase [Verrucomicrobiota bacterium]